MRLHRLRVEAEKAKSALAAQPEDPKRQSEAVVAAARRREFWQDTCREVREMHNTSLEILELYQEHGCCFLAPDEEEVQEILDALDAALPLWDRDHPELFYQTLRMNFPELAHRTRT